MATDIRAERREPAQPDRPESTAPQSALSARRSSPVGVGELTSAGSALALLTLMFVTKWYGVAGVPDPSAARPAVSTAVDAWHGLTIVRWVMLLTVLVAVGSVVLHVSQRSHGVQTDTSRLVTVLGSLTAVLLIYRVLIALPAADRITDQKLGAALAVICALGIALGGRQSMLEAERSRPGATARRRRDRRPPAKISSDNAAPATERGRVK
jgi:hypothetical protein